MRRVFHWLEILIKEILPFLQFIKEKCLRLMLNFTIMFSVIIVIILIIICSKKYLLFNICLKFTNVTKVVLVLNHLAVKIHGLVVKAKVF